MLLKVQWNDEVTKQIDEDGHINRELSTEEIVGQCLVFFLGGMETTSNALLHTLLELALNQDIQERLYEEISECYSTDLTSYDDIGKSKYLEAVINEVLRKYPALNRLFRVCLSDYDFGEFKATKGQIMGLSLYNMHFNPELYPEPEKFKPERFLNGEVDFNNFAGFGQGPRHCVAERFALLEMKALLIQLVKRFKFYTNENTMNYTYRNAVIANMVNDLRLRIEKRN